MINYLTLQMSWKQFVANSNKKLQIQHLQSLKLFAHLKTLAFALIGSSVRMTIVCFLIPCRETG